MSKSEKQLQFKCDFNGMQKSKAVNDMKTEVANMEHSVFTSRILINNYGGRENSAAVLHH